MYPDYARLQALLGPNGAPLRLHRRRLPHLRLLQYGEEDGPAPGIYGKVGLMIGWGPGKTELILPPD